MRPSIVVSVFVAGLLAVGVLVGSQYLGGAEPPTVDWQTDQEILVATADPLDPAAAETGGAEAERQLLAAAELDAADGERTALLLRGRVVDRFQRAVPGASVWLDFGRGGPRDRGQQRRVPDPVTTDREGRFAFRGQTFRNLRVSLLVVHSSHAPTWFERNLGDVLAEMDLGDLLVADGGEMIGRVTDLDGNGVPGAEVRLQPENDNRMRFRREQDVLAAVVVDNNGYYRLAHVAAGSWRVAATAAHHQNGSSDTVSLGDEQRIEVADIRLGPGYELTGVVSDAQSVPIADAEVVARSRGEPGENGRGGRGGPGGGPGRGGPGFGGSEFRARTNAQGRFFLEHLPGTAIEITARKEGFLNFRQTDVDAKLGQPLFITLQDGLRITGVVTDAATGDQVTRFRVQADRIRGLPTGNGDANFDWAAAMQQMRDGSLDEAARQELRARMEGMRGQGGGPGGGGQRGGGGGRGDGQGGNGGPRRDRRMQDHPDGRFLEAGLQEGIYVVVVESNRHATWRSAELELRLGAPAPDLAVALDHGFAVRGLVLDTKGEPIVGAEVELRSVQDEAADGAAESNNNGNRGRRGGRGRGAEALRQAFQGGGAVASATTDRQGRFAIEHAAIGRYRVEASAKGHDQARSEPFALAADLAGVELRLGSLGRLEGKVLGASKEQLAEVRVVAAPIGESADLGAMFRGGGRPFAVVTADGHYRFDELKPGAYAVRAFTGTAMRELFTQFTSGEMLADVEVKAGETATIDVALTVSQAGSVQGSVLHNGAAASGFHVAVRRADDGTGNDNGGGGRRGGGGFGGRDFSATVDGQGQFRIADVPAGTYQLTVSGDRRSGTLHAETVVVIAQTATPVTISVTTATIEGTVTADDGTPATDLDGNVMLLPGATEMPADAADLRRNGSAFRARVQDGRFAIEMLPPGSYLAVLMVRGRDRSALQVVATIGQRSQVTIPVGKKAAVDAATDRSGGGGGGGGPAGGGRRAGNGGGGSGDTAEAPTRRGRRGQ